MTRRTNAKTRKHENEPLRARFARQEGLVSRPAFASSCFRVSLIALFGATAAHAGGLARPNGISARGTGMGGAWTAWADDASAVYFNPAALDDVDQQIDVGGELVFGPRSYTPIATDGTRGAAQKSTVVAPVPSAGVVGRFYYNDRPSRFTLGAGLWNTFGGQVTWPKSGQPALDSTEDVALEADAGTSLRISDKLSIGGTVRFGLGLFSIAATADPFDSQLSASGVGVSTAWGALVRPTPNVRIGLAWRAPLRVTTEGNGTVTLTSTPTPEAVRHDQVWPQQASLGVGWRPAPPVRLAVQADWTEWSQVKEITVRFPANPALDQVFREDWKDSWTMRVGGEYQWSAFALRGGAYYDTYAVPDRTIERQYLDSNKIGLAAGASVRAAGWRFDAALDWVLPSTRTVPNNVAQTASFPADRNIAPGDYRGTLVTVELSVGHGF
jgi:long-chain fatty acid transport protein